MAYEPYRCTGEADRKTAQQAAAALAHDVGKYMTMAARNLPDGEVPEVLREMLVRDLYALDGARTASEVYAERVALEEGMHETPYDQLGALSAELFRAVRLVVDTGIHAKRWTREEATRYMIVNAGLPEGDAGSEIDRYIVNPGQACAYKIGQLKILELRARATERLGSAFDLRGFNDLVLSNGALPLDILDGVVADWDPR